MSEDGEEGKYMVLFEEKKWAKRLKRRKASYGGQILPQLLISSRGQQTIAQAKPTYLFLYIKFY